MTNPIPHPAEAARERVASFVRRHALTVWDEWKAEGCPGTWPEYLGDAIERVCVIDMLGPWPRSSTDV